MIIRPRTIIARTVKNAFRRVETLIQRYRVVLYIHYYNIIIIARKNVFC